MQVILTQNIRKLGNIGDVVDVKIGFARNYLLPQGKAFRATKAHIEDFAQKKSEIEKQNQEKIAQAKQIAGKVDGTKVLLIRQASEDGRLFGSVRTQDIAEAVNAKVGTALTYRNVNLNDAIRAIGVYQIELELHSEVFAKIVVAISRSESEAEALAKKSVAQDKTEEKAEQE
jgi:large subunit ribosomal protein L9